MSYLAVGGQIGRVRRYGLTPNAVLTESRAGAERRSDHLNQAAQEMQPLDSRREAMN